MEREIYGWTERFGMRFLGRPEEFRNVIPVVEDSHAGTQTPSVVKFNRRLRGFLALAPSDRKNKGKEMLLQNATELIERIDNREFEPNEYFQLVEHGTEQLILSTRDVLMGEKPGTREFDMLEEDMGEFAAALSCLDPRTTDIRLLSIEYYLYNPIKYEFIFAHRPPGRIRCIRSLEDLIEYRSSSKAPYILNQRIKIAYKLAEAVFFLHTAGFVHKNITTSSVVILSSSHSDTASAFDRNVFREAYLMGLNLIRGVHACSDPSSVVPPWVWNRDISQHLDRLRRTDGPKYVKPYDTYSLGVVLLTIGLWRTLSAAAWSRIKVETPLSQWTEQLIGLAPQIGPIVGNRYQRIVEWCLGMTRDQNLRDMDFV
ncbi:hypothetical protein PT974_02281 [Cladobotryum mycophilum]|uniref:Protein kinase domain-containing protein n=1 Tax=Cladobotryum mycophilum TaxID=491253 RepID=A0ABR0SY49_9HYPO